MKKVLFIALGVLFMSGCIPRYAWNHATNGEMEFNADSAICQAQAVREVPSTPPPPQVNITQSQSIYGQSDAWMNDLVSGNTARSTRNNEIMMHNRAISNSRDAIYKGCMHEKGYYMERVE